MCRTTRKQTVKFLQSVLNRLNMLQTFDSKVRDDGWTVTSRSDHYVAFNKHTHIKYSKVIYVVSVRKNPCCLCLRLYISVDNPKVDDFRTVAEHNRDAFRKLNGNRDRGVERYFTLNCDGDMDAAISSVFDKLDALYKTYNAIVDVGCMSRCKCSSKHPVSIEILSEQRINPKYNLSWERWNHFYDKWDAFVKDWFESETNPIDDLTKTLEKKGAFRLENADTGLIKNELPEPYYGNGEIAKCAIVNLNPGASCNGEAEKIFGKGGFLIESFESDCNKMYSLFAEKWSPLRDDKVHDWWHNENRKKFFKRFWGVQDLTEIFSLEACPYHSKNWSGGLDAIERHVIDNVITPAAVIAERNNNCAVFVGSVFNPVISKIKGVESIGRWRGTRVYSLYKLTRPIEGLNNRNPIFLLVVNGTQGMYLPQSNKSNDSIEKVIHSIVNGHS